MRAKPPSVPDTVFRIVAVLGSLALLPVTSFGASANESPSDDGAVPADVSAPAAIDLVPCAPAEVPATPQQVPPGDPEGAECVDEHGYDGPCDPDDIIAQCIKAANEELDECAEDAGFWGRARCGVEHSLDLIACATNFLKEILI